MFLIIVNQILKMLLLLLLGCLCYRMKLVDQAGNKVLANLLLMVVNPCVAITSLQTDYNAHLAQGLIAAYVLAFVIHLIACILSTILIRKTGNPNCGIDRFCAIYSNCGFIGIPLVQSILGSEGVLYLTAYMTVFNIFSWTHGVVVMNGSASKEELKKGLLSPMIFACFLGLLLFFGRMRLSPTISDAMNYVAGMNTPLAMMIAGVAVAQTDLLGMLKNKRLYLISAGKLVIMPALTLVLLALVRTHVDKTVAYTILVAASCPVAASGTAFALRFHKNYTYASQLYALTTIGSLLTVPMFVYAAEQLLA